MGREGNDRPVGNRPSEPEPPSTLDPSGGREPSAPEAPVPQPAFEPESAPVSEPYPQAETDRRRFLARAVAGAAALVGTAFAGLSAVYVAGGSGGRRGDRWVPVARLDRLEPGQPLRVEYLELVPDAWTTIRRRRALWVLRGEDGSVTAFDPRCTHLGCPIDWHPGERAFKCPCHRGAFDEQGNVVSGPPPRPLDLVEGRIEDGRLFVPATAST